MGYRSTFTSNDSGLVFPDWFVEKYKGSIYFPRNSDDQPTTPISSKREQKMYGTWADLLTNIEQVVQECPKEGATLNLIVLHEDTKMDFYSFKKGRSYLQANFASPQEPEE